MSIDLNSVKINLIKTQNEVKQFYKKYHEDIKKLDNKPFTQIIFINQLLKDIKELKEKNKLLENQIENQIENQKNKIHEQQNEIENFNRLNKKARYTVTKRHSIFNIGKIWS